MRVQLTSKAWIKNRLWRRGEIIEMPDNWKPPKGSIVISTPNRPGDTPDKQSPALGDKK